MTKNSMAGLSAKLQQQLKSDQEAVNSQTETLLGQHASALKELSDAALSTTRGVMGEQAQQLQASISRHGQEIEALHAKMVKRLRWLLLWPLMVSVCLSLGIVGGAVGWGWWKVSQAEAKVSEQAEVLRQLTEDFCKTPAGKKDCTKGK